MVALYPNGTIPQSALDPVPCIGGSAWLLPIPAAAYLEVVAEVERRHGWSPVITSAGDGFRSYQRQVNVFLERYEPRKSGGTDVRWWNGVRYVRVRGAAAAIPGTSNHGKGITVDVSGLGAFTSTRYRQFKAVAEPRGWSNAEGSRIGEPWHWNYTRTAYPVVDTNTLPSVTIPTLPGDLPAPLTPEDDMPYTPAELEGIVLGALAKRDLEMTTRATPYGRQAAEAAAGWARALTHRLVTGAATRGTPTDRQIGNAVNAIITGDPVDLSGAVTDDDLARIQKAVNDEADRRARARANVNP